jgi:hypothetical protein
MFGIIPVPRVPSQLSRTATVNLCHTARDDQMPVESLQQLLDRLTGQLQRGELAEPLTRVGAAVGLTLLFFGTSSRLGHRLPDGALRPVLVVPELHYRILDQLHGAGIEITSPHYRAMRAGPTAVQEGNAVPTPPEQAQSE